MADDDADPIRKSEAEWREQLSPEQFRVTRKAGTERAFTGRYWDEKTPGEYACVCCGAVLFSSDHKYDSGSGWPSFFEAVDRGRLLLEEDRSLGMRRVEVKCARCEAHLGHLFPDGPQPTGERFCINSAALDLNPRG